MCVALIAGERSSLVGSVCEASGLAIANASATAETNSRGRVTLWNNIRASRTRPMLSHECNRRDDEQNRRERDQGVYDTNAKRLHQRPTPARLVDVPQAAKR